MVKIVFSPPRVSPFPFRRESSEASRGGKRRNSHQSAVFGKAGNGTVVGISELARREGFEPPAFWSVATLRNEMQAFLLLSGPIDFGSIFFPTLSVQWFQQDFSCSGSDYGSGIQNGLTGRSQKRDILLQRIPHSARVNSTIGMNVKIPRVLDYTPGNGGVLLLYCIGEQCDQLADLYHTHAAGILEKMVIFKGRKIVMKPVQIFRNTQTVHHYLLKDHNVTSFDIATPHLC